MLHPLYRKRWWQQRYEVPLLPLLPGPSSAHMARVTREVLDRQVGPAQGTVRQQLCGRYGPLGYSHEPRNGEVGIGMATGNSPSGNDCPSPSPRGEKKSPSPSPSMLAGDNFIPSPTPCGEFVPAGSPLPTKEKCRHRQRAIKKICWRNKSESMV
jgi:hypothetical protein